MIAYIIIVAIVIICLYKKTEPFFSSNKIISRVDGRAYKVQGEFTDKGHAADIMAVLKEIMINVLYHMKKDYPTHPMTKKLLARYDPDKKRENRPNNSDDSTSYTINKGEMLYFCLRDKKDNKIHNPNDLIFVAIHEMAHIAINEFNHPPIFWQAFKRLLIVAAQHKLYKPVDYSAHPVVYCGLDVRYNPLFDSSLTPL